MTCGRSSERRQSGAKIDLSILDEAELLNYSSVSLNKRNNFMYDKLTGARLPIQNHKSATVSASISGLSWC